MRSRQFKLSIEKPCSQDWTSMTENEQGRFCERCAKSVMDYTSLSDKELIHAISSSSNPICGKLKSQQLNRIIVSEREHIFLSPYKFLSALFLLSVSKNIFGANLVGVKQPIIQSFVKEQIINMQLTDSNDTLIHVIEGIVIDEELEPIPGVIVEIQNTELKAISDIDGKFKFILPDSFDSIVITLCSKYPGGTIEDVVFDRSKRNSTIEMMLISTATELEMIGMLKMSKPKKWWQFRKRH